MYWSMSLFYYRYSLLLIPNHQPLDNNIAMYMPKTNIDTSNIAIPIREYLYPEVTSTSAQHYHIYIIICNNNPEY